MHQLSTKVRLCFAGPTVPVDLDGSSRGGAPGTRPRNREKVPIPPPPTDADLQKTSTGQPGGDILDGQGQSRLFFEGANFGNTYVM